jgi:hypothetical protein
MPGEYPPMPQLQLPEPAPTPPLPDLRRWSPRTHRTLLLLAGLAAAAAPLVYFGGERFSLVARLPSPLWFAGASTALRAVSSLDEHRGQRDRQRVVGIVGTLALLVVGGTTLATLRTVSPETVSSPTGAFAAVVTQGPPVVDPPWTLTVHQNAGLFSRVWYAGCLNPDDPANAYAGMSWTSNTTLEVRTRGGRRLVVTTDETGMPLNLVTAGADSCR